MSKSTSCGLLMFYKNNDDLRVFLVHPGGPFFAKKDEGWWGIPKGLPEEDEELLTAAKREFEEETGIKPGTEFIPLGTVVQKGGKTVHCWAFETKNCEPIQIDCNTFNLEWPPGSGKINQYPEVDKGEFFPIEAAEIKINSAQKEFLIRLQNHLHKEEGK